MKTPKPKSNASSDLPDWLDLNLHHAEPAQAPVDHPEPNAELALEHGMELALGLTEAQWLERRHRMNPERFIL